MTSLPIDPALCNEAEFDYYVSDFDMKDILQTVEILQKEMAKEQRTFDKLSSLIADLSPRCRGSTEYAALSNQMMESQARLAMLMGRNMKCFSQQTSLEQETNDAPIREGSPSLTGTQSSSSQIPPQFQDPEDIQSSQIDYKKRRHKTAPVPTATSWRTSSGSSTESHRNGSESWDEPHGDESSARAVEDSDCSDASDGYNVYMDDCPFDDSFSDEPSGPPSDTLGLGSNDAVDYNNDSGFPRGFNFPKIDINGINGDCDLMTMLPREGGPMQSPKTKKIANRVVDQIKTEHRRYSLKTPPYQPIGPITFRERHSVSDMSLEGLKQKYYGSSFGDFQLSYSNTHSAEVDSPCDMSAELREGTPENSSTASYSTDTGKHGISHIEHNHNQKNTTSCFYEPLNTEPPNTKPPSTEPPSEQLQLGTVKLRKPGNNNNKNKPRRKSASDLYVVNKLFPIKEAIDLETEELQSRKMSKKSEMMINLAPNVSRNVDPTVDKHRRSIPASRRGIPASRPSGRSAVVSNALGVSSDSEDDVKNHDDAEEDARLTDHASDVEENNNESTTDSGASIVKTKVNFGQIKLQLRAISQERLNLDIDRKICLLNSDLNSDSKTEDTIEDDTEELRRKSQGSFTTVVPSITDSTESTNGTVTNGNGIKSEVRSNGVHVTSIPCNGLSKKDIKAEHKLPNGLTSQIKQSNGTSKLPSNGTPEISANGTSGLSSHEQRIPNGSLPSHTTIPPSSPTTTVLPPAFMPSQGFTAEDKVNERVTLKSWDPTKLLNELYAIRLVADLEKPPNYINTEGYLEKLPTNKKKATLLKTWKKRYFRTKNGRLSYYENGKAAKNDTGDNVYKNSHQHDKSHGYLQLTDGTIEVLGNHMLGVDDKRGHYMVLRCHTDEEFSKWKRSLDSQTVDYCKMNYVKPVLYSQPSTEKKVVIVDIGSCSVRAGILGEQPSLPQIFFPCIVATSKDGSDRVLGVDAMKPSTRSTRNLTYPVRPSIKIDKCSMDMEVMPDIFSKVFHDLKINPAEHWMMFSTPGNFNDTIKADFMTMFIQKFGMCGANIVNQTLLSLYSYNSQTGIVVDIGERLEIVPVTDGYIADAGVTRQPYGGHRVTEAMNSALTEYKYRFFTDVEFQLVRLITEKTSFVSENYAHDIKQSSTNIEAYRRITDMEQYDLPKGSWSHIVSDIGRFKSTEGLFSTGIWGLDNPPLHTLVQKAVQACPMDMRKQMWRSIFLSGGTSMIPGFPERLQAELQKLAPGSVNVKVIASPQRYHAAYIGACTMASLGGAFEQACISAKQWNSEGTSSLSKWHMY